VPTFVIESRGRELSRTLTEKGENGCIVGGGEGDRRLLWSIKEQKKSAKTASLMRGGNRAKRQGNAGSRAWEGPK